MGSSFPYSSNALKAKVRKAVRQYWGDRRTQGARQGASGRVDVGGRREVTSGRHLDGFVDLVCDLIRKAGFEEEHILVRSRVDLPGYYRPTKQWDIAVVKDGRLCAAIEMKSQIGPSFGNNFNNRAEEAIGSSVDFWTSFREGTLGTQRPWLGYLFLLEEHPKSTAPVRLSSSSFPPDEIFEKTSYADRYAILCRRLVYERNYDSATLLLSSRSGRRVYREPEPDLGIEPWARSLYGHLIGCL